MQHALISATQGVGAQYDAIAAQLSDTDRALVEDLSQPVVSDREELIDARILRTRLASYQTVERW